MKNNETGEFELVVGDRLLLSAFFIVVMLCAVAFAMGYVVGQSAPKTAKASAETAPAASAPPSAADARPQPLPPAPTAAAPADPAAPPADSSPQPTTKPSQGSQPPPAQTASAAAESAAGIGMVAADDLPAGNFWQVMATATPQAENLRITLKDHGFAVMLSPGTKGLTRVLVGPYADTQAFAKAKTELENAGLRPVRYKP